MAVEAEMKALLLTGSMLALVGAVLLLRIVYHGYADHAHLDLFHLVVGLVVATAGALMLHRALRRTVA
jgi:hypothetical protein